MNASIITSSDERGTWKLVSMTSTTRHRCPEWMNRSVWPSARRWRLPTRGPAPRGADGDDRVARSHAARCRGHDVALGVHDVVLDPGGGDRTEGAETDFELDTADAGAAFAAAVRAPGVRCRPAVGAAAEPGRGVHGLVALGVVERSRM
jgi:hypothetical protein